MIQRDPLTEQQQRANRKIGLMLGLVAAVFFLSYVARQWLGAS